MSDAQVPETIDQDGKQVAIPATLNKRTGLGTRKKKLAELPSLRREMITAYRAYCMGTINEGEYKTLMTGLKMIRDGVIDEEKLELMRGQGGGTAPFTGVTLVAPPEAKAAE